MPPAVLFLKSRFAAAVADRRYAGQIALLAAVHLAAFGILVWSEVDLEAQAAFILAWGMLNLFWLSLLRRPLTSAALSLAMIVLLIVVSQFKQSVTAMTATFVDVMIVDLATFSFLMTIIPGLAWKVGLIVALAIPVLILTWMVDPFRVRRSVAVAGCLACFAALAGLSLAIPTDREDEFSRQQYISKFARSGAVAVVDLMTRGVLEADGATADHLSLATAGACDAGRKDLGRKDLGHKRPHIVMVFDESSFDATMLPNIKTPTGYRERFRSGDGRIRSLIVEGAGGPSWYAEYNVLTGLSVRSYGRFAESVTRLAAGRIKHGLPFALRNCGYRTYSLYSWFGAFVGARNFQTSTGIEHFLDARQLRTGTADTDSFYYGRAAEVLAKERGNGPVFVFVYLAANHFPWTYRYRPELLSDWKNLGNPSDVDEYLRRQQLSVQDYAAFKARLAREFPNDAFLLVRFGDHQPLFAKEMLEPALTQSEVARRILDRDPRYFTTYYATEGLNFQPVDQSAALDTLDAPYLPLVVLGAAGLPLDPAFAEQRKILNRCNGLFYLCADGAEARRYNRLLIDAGLIQGF